MPTPDTLGYMIGGYVAAGLIMLGLIVYLITKARRLRADIEMLKQLEKEDQEKR